MDLDELLALAHDPGTPPATLSELSRDPSARVRTAVAARPDAQADVLRRLTRDYEREVREAVARNPATSRGNLLRLVSDPDRWVRWAVAGNPACDEDIRRAMAKTADKELRGLLAESPDLEPDLAQGLIADKSPEVRERLAAHTRDSGVIDALLRDRTVRVRKGLARNELTSPQQRHKLAADPAPDVRSALVRAVELAEADLLLLVADRSAEVRRAMATSALIPDTVRRALENDPDEAVAAEAKAYRPTARPPRRGPKRFVTGR